MKVRITKTFSIFDPSDFTPHRIDFIGEECDLEPIDEMKNPFFWLKRKKGEKIILSKETIAENTEEIKENA